VVSLASRRGPGRRAPREDGMQPGRGPGPDHGGAATQPSAPPPRRQLRAGPARRAPRTVEPRATPAATGGQEPCPHFRRAHHENRLKGRSRTPDT
jgi:hypothetical protein